MSGVSLLTVPAGSPNALSAGQASALGGNGGTPGAQNPYVLADQPYVGKLSARYHAGLALDGTTDDTAALSAFLSAFGSRRGRLYVEGPMRLTAPVTLPKTLEIEYAPGAMLSPDAGVQVTHLSPYVDGYGQRFDCSKGGYVTFSASGDFTGAGYVGAVRPEHWGAAGDGSTLDTAAMQHWANAIMGYPFAESSLADLSTPRWADCVGLLRGGANYRVQAQGRRPPIQFVATHGVRIIGAGGGAGGTQSAGSTITGIGGGQFTCTDASTTTTLVLSGTPNLVPNAWQGGILWVVSGPNMPSASSSLWTGLLIASNDAGSITLATAQALPFDHTSTIILACDAIFDFNGVWGDVSDVTLLGDTSSGYYTTLFRYWRDSMFSSLGASTGRFERLSAEGRWLEAGIMFGGGLWQSDLNQEDNTYSPALSARATSAWNPATPWNQTGIYVGSGTPSNNLNHAIDNVDSLNVRYALYVNETNVSVQYGELSNCDVSVMINGGTQGTFVCEKLRCEKVRQAFNSSRAAAFQVPQTYRIGVLEFKANNLANDPITGTADVMSFGALTYARIDEIRIAAIDGVSPAVTAGSATSLTFTGTPFATVDPTGWRVRAQGGTGAGQTAIVASFTSNSVSFAAVAIPFDATTTVIVMPIPRVRMVAGPWSLLVNGVSVENAGFEEFFVLANNGYVHVKQFLSIDTSSGTQTARYVRDAILTSAANPQYTQSWRDFGTDAGLDVRVGRSAPGVYSASELSTLHLRTIAAGKTAQPFVENSAGTGGGLHFGYALVGKIVDPTNPNAFIVALASDEIVVTTNGNPLSWPGDGSAHGSMRLHTSIVTPALPFTHYDVLKNSGSGLQLLEANVPAYRLDPKGAGGYYDYGLVPTTPYTPPATDGTGVLAHGGALAGFFGTAPIAKPSVSGSRGGNVALTSLLSQLAALGLITDGSTT